MFDVWPNVYVMIKTPFSNLHYSLSYTQVKSEQACSFRHQNYTLKINKSHLVTILSYSEGGYCTLHYITNLSIILSLKDSMSSLAGTLRQRWRSDFMMDEKVSLLASVVASFFRASSLSSSRNVIILSCIRVNKKAQWTYYWVSHKYWQSCGLVLNPLLHSRHSVLILTPHNKLKLR